MKIGGCFREFFCIKSGFFFCYFRKLFVNLGKLIFMFLKKIGSSYKFYRIIVLKVKCILINI